MLIPRRGCSRSNSRGRETAMCRGSRGNDSAPTTATVLGGALRNIMPSTPQLLQLQDLMLWGFLLGEKCFLSCNSPNTYWASCSWEQGRLNHVQAKTSGPNPQNV